MLAQYDGVDAAAAREHLAYFIRAVAPVAEEAGILLAIHPDDPPVPLLGLPRVVSTAEDLRFILDASDSPANGLCFCAGSLASRPGNDVAAMARAFAARIHFVHLRNVKKGDAVADADGNPVASFVESDHLDGDVPVAAVVAEFGVMHKAKRPPLVPLDGAQHIARTYKFALTRAFEDVFPDAPAVLVVEDDLVVSKDFFDYFSAVAPALERDDSLFVASAWNDNGFAKHGDPGAVRRTGWFPGLGWLLPRKLWETELHPQWPDGHWDHWMRSDEVARGRECVYPVVNRASHESEYGTFLDSWHDKRYFKPIVRQRSRFDWPSDAWRSVLSDVYEDRVRGLLAAAEHVSDVNAAVVGSALDTTTPLALWFDFEENDDAPPGAADAWAPPPFVCVSEPFDLWHESRRGDHRGVHEVVGAAGRPVLLVKAPVAYDSLRPDGLTPLARSECPSAVSYTHLTLPTILLV